MVSDAAYDSNALKEMIVAQGAVAVIYPLKNSVEDRPWLKQYSRVATCYDKYANRYLGFIYFLQLTGQTRNAPIQGFSLTKLFKVKQESCQ